MDVRKRTVGVRKRTEKCVRDKKKCAAGLLKKEICRTLSLCNGPSFRDGRVKGDGCGHAVGPKVNTLYLNDELSMINDQLEDSWPVASGLSAIRLGIEINQWIFVTDET